MSGARRRRPRRFGLRGNGRQVSHCTKRRCIRIHAIRASRNGFSRAHQGDGGVASEVSLDPQGHALLDRVGLSPGGLGFFGALAGKLPSTDTVTSSVPAFEIKQKGGGIAGRFEITNSARYKN